MAHAKSFRDLDVYKLSRDLAKEIFETFKKLSERRNLFSYRSGETFFPLNWSTNSEAWAKRRYEKHFISKLTDVDGEQQETQHWLETAFDCSYIDENILDKILKRYESVGKMIYGMINKSNLFCKEN